MFVGCCDDVVFVMKFNGLMGDDFNSCGNLC